MRRLSRATPDLTPRPPCRAASRSLAWIMPVVVRGLREGKGEVKVKAATVCGNVVQLLTDVDDVVPFAQGMLEELTKALEHSWPVWLTDRALPALPPPPVARRPLARRPLARSLVTRRPLRRLECGSPLVCLPLASVVK